MSFGNPGLQLLFFLSYVKTNVTTGARRFGAWLCGVLLRTGCLNRHHLHPFLKSHFTFVCLNDDLQERAGDVLLWSILFHLFEIKSLAITAKCIFLFDRGLGCVNMISNKTEALHWGILI